ncbi:hypothetical protein FIBSPDRAFT_962084 [Athelia psychrophila]|uniref:Uncharacterized protein n=1 Tax=Athelia psychrophila TaxID=1759441 RepID=A0A166AJT8_9AGAM|nr:hypothetical protein FIBSPDRAFT_962084 [Fibularhizoctonia sp. CBS 109695]
MPRPQPTTLMYRVLAQHIVPLEGVAVAFTWNVTCGSVSAGTPGGVKYKCPGEEIGVAPLQAYLLKNKMNIEVATSKVITRVVRRILYRSLAGCLAWIKQEPGV